jgi:hypothetical protein
MTETVAPCGLVCSECEAYAATQAGDAEAIAAIAPEWSRRYGVALKPDDIWCDGCASESERTIRHARECPIRPCAREQGLVSCATCEQYPCDNLKQLHRTAPQARERLEAVRRMREST